MILRLFSISILFQLFIFSNINAQLPAGFYDEELNKDWNFPVGITFSPSGKCFIWEKDGYLFTTDSNFNKKPEPIIDISEEVISYLDHGLIGFCLDPNFSENGYVYLMYIVDRHHLLYYGTSDYDENASLPDEATIGRISRFTLDIGADFNTLKPDSKHILIGKSIEDGFPVISASHGAGSLVFGTDGSLLASFGDQGSFTGPDNGSHPDTDFLQALNDGILLEKENIGAYKSQLIDNLNGKIIRINPITGKGLTSNPFYDEFNPDLEKSKIYTLGIRNGFRFIKIPETGSHNIDAGDPGILILGDVGASNWEEINIIRNAGANLGWPVYEGHHKNEQFISRKALNLDVLNEFPDSCNQAFLRFDQLIFDEHINPFPIPHPCSQEDTLSRKVGFIHKRADITYVNVKSGLDTLAYIPLFDQEGKGYSVSIEDSISNITGRNFGGFTSIAGLFYQGEKYPSEYINQYFHCDLSGWIKNIRFDQDYHILSIEDFHTDVPYILGMALNPADGQIYYINALNELHRIGFGGNQKPTAIIETSAQYGSSPLTINLNAQSSFDTDGEISQYLWNLGDGTTSDKPIIEHTYEASKEVKTFNVVLNVIDNEGGSDSTSVNISLNNSPPIARITSLQDGQYYPAYQFNNYSLEAEITDLKDDVVNLKYKWEVFLHHNTHFHPEPVYYSPIATAHLQPLGCNEESYWYRILLTVEDGGGLIGTDEIEIFPSCEEGLLDFIKVETKPNNEFIPINFIVEKGTEIDYYVIEKSEDKIQFAGVTTILDQNAQTNYQYSDKQAKIGKQYYRIKGVTKSGLVIHSPIVSAIFPTFQDIILFPNPVESKINIFAENANGLLRFRLFDLNGKQVMQDSWPTQNGDFKKSFSLPYLAAGMYFYSISHGNGNASGHLIIH